MCLRDKDILDFIDVHPGLIAKSGVISGCLRDSAGSLGVSERLRGKSDSVFLWRTSSVCEGQTHPSPRQYIIYKN